MPGLQGRAVRAVVPVWWVARLPPSGPVPAQGVLRRSTADLAVAGPWAGRGTAALGSAEAVPGAACLGVGL